MFSFFIFKMACFKAAFIRALGIKFICGMAALKKTHHFYLIW